MDRLMETVKIINKLNVKDVLDVGCRDCSLRNLLSAKIRCKGLDLYQNINKSVDYVGDVETLDIKSKFDVVVAIDILEHVENPYLVFDKLYSIAKKYIVISLPNTYDLKSKFNFIFFNTLGGKYQFNPSYNQDRHRWMMNCDEIRAFYEKKAADNNLRFSTHLVRYGEIRFNFISLVGKIISCLFGKESTTSSIIGIFEKY